MHTATTDISTLSRRDALPIPMRPSPQKKVRAFPRSLTPPSKSELPKNPHFPTLKEPMLYLYGMKLGLQALAQDRKSTRLNSSHGYISYAVFGLKNRNVTLFDS